MDRSSLTLADEHIKYMEWFLDEVTSVQTNEPVENVEKIAEVLKWHLKIAKVHYRNLLHCYKIAESNTTS